MKTIVLGIGLLFCPEPDKVFAADDARALHSYISAAYSRTAHKKQPQYNDTVEMGSSVTPV